jgi:hypothetical protein
VPFVHFFDGLVRCPDPASFERGDYVPILQPFIPEPRP